MNEIILPCVVVIFYIGMLIGAYLHKKYVTAQEKEQHGTIKNVNTWIKRVL